MNKLKLVLSFLSNILRTKIKTFLRILAILSGIAAADYLLSKYFSVLKLFLESIFIDLWPVLNHPTVVSIFSWGIVAIVLILLLFITQIVIKRIVRAELQARMLDFREATINHFRSMSDEVAGNYFLTGDTCLISGLYRSTLGKGNTEKYVRRGNVFPHDENNEELTAIWELID